MKRSDLEKAELELQGIQKSKKKLLPRVKRKKYSKKSHELHNAIEKNQDSLEIEIERLKVLFGTINEIFHLPLRIPVTFLIPSLDL